MRWLLWIIGLAAAATALTLLGGFNEGYVLVALPGQRIELSLNLAVILLLLGFISAYALLRLLFTAIDLPARVAALRARRKAEGAQHALLEALRDFFAGRFARAEKGAVRAVELGAAPDVGAVIAAHAAHGLRDRPRRDAHLERLEQGDAAQAPIRAVARARMLIDDQRPEEALAALAMLPVKHTAALRLELRARQRLKQWELAPALIDQLEKRGVFSADQADAERRHAWLQMIPRQAGDSAALAALWKRVPERHRRDAIIAAAAATVFQALGESAQARGIIEAALDAEWDAALVQLYGEQPGDDALRRIEQAERWLKTRREDAALLLTLGRLCAHQQLWGKAQSYLEASIAIEATYTAHLELARLHEGLERGDEARRHYRESLELAAAQLQRASGGRRRRTV
jgi:HemY protein